MKHQHGYRWLVWSLLVGFFLAGGAMTQAQEVVTRAIRQFGLGTLTCSAYSPDGRQVLTAGSGGAFLWDVETSRLVHSFLWSASVHSVAFSPDGSKVIAGLQDGTAKLWDSITGTEIRTIGQPSDNINAEINAVAFSPDGTTVLIGGGSVGLWDVASGKGIKSFSGHGFSIWSVAFSPDGSKVVIGERYSAVLWDVATGNEIRSFTGHTADILAVAFSPDGRKILTGSMDYTAKLWNVASGTLIRTFGQQSNIISFVAFSPDGSNVLTGWDYGVKYWDPTTGNELRSLKDNNNYSVASIALSPDGSKVLIVSQDYSVKSYDTATGALIRSFADGPTGTVYSVVLSPDGSKVLIGSDVPRLWDVATGTLEKKYAGHSDWVLSAAFSPDGSKVLTGSCDSSAKLWDIATGACIFTLTGQQSSIYCVAYSPDGSKVLIGSAYPILLDAMTGALLHNFSDQPGPRSMTFSPDGSKILISSGDSKAKLWDITTGSLLHTFEHSASVTSVAFSPDGCQILTGSEDGRARLWDMATGTMIRSFYCPYIYAQNAILSLAFSPDGKKMLTGSYDRKARLWDVATGELLRVYTGHNDSVYYVAFSPDGNRVMTGSYDRTARIWDATGLIDSIHPLKLVAPNGGETLQSGSEITVGWRADLATVGSGVRFELWDGATRIEDLGYGWNPTGTGGRALYLPLVPAGSNYKIRAISTWDPTLFDDSDSTLTITGGVVRIIRPAGGEAWRAGERQWISWDSNPLFAGTAIQFDLTRNGAWVADLGIGFDPDGEGAMEITVPPVESSDDYKVRAVCVWQPDWWVENTGFISIRNDQPRNAVRPQHWSLYQ